MNDDLDDNEIDEEEFERLNFIYEGIAEFMNFTASDWCIYEVEDFTAVPFPTAQVLIREPLWYGPRKELFQHIPENSTWLDLWKAADGLMVQAGPADHRFIEGFAPDKGDPRVLRLQLGS
jgi:hypothetical protein